MTEPTKPTETPAPRARRTHAAAVALVVLVAAAVRALFLSQPIRYDEAVTFAAYARAPLAGALADYALPNNHLLHTLLLGLTWRALSAVAGAGVASTEWAVRLPAFAAGVLVVPATYWAARRVYGRGAGAVAAGLAAGSGPLVFYSANARGYALVALAAALLWGVADALRTGGRWRAWGPAYVACGALGAWAVPTMLFPFAAVTAWLAAESLVGGTRDPARRVLPRLALACAATGAVAALLYLPVLLRHGPGAITDNRFVAPRPLAEVAAAAPGWAAGVGRAWATGVPAWVGWAALAPAAGATLLHPWLPGARRSGSRVPPLAAAVVVTAALLLVQRRLPYARVFTWALPTVLGAAGAGLVALVGLIARAVRRGDRSVVATQATAAIAVVVACGLSWSLWASGELWYSNETGSLVDGPAIVDDVLARAAANEAAGGGGTLLLVRSPVNAPVAYRLDRLGVGRGLIDDFADPRRVYAVVRWPAGRPDDADRRDAGARRALAREFPAKRRNLRRSDYGPPALVREFDRADLYEFARKPGR